MEKLLSYFKNFYVLLGVLFLLWMFVFDGNDFLTQVSNSSRLKELETQKDYYRVEIQKIQEDIEELRTDEAMLEKFAREKYLMKKPGYF